jgi:hypothetical protein
MTSNIARANTAGSAEPVKLDETSGDLNYLCGLLGLDGGAWLVDPYLAGSAGASSHPRGNLSGGGSGVIEDLLAAWDRPGAPVVHRCQVCRPILEMPVVVVVVGEEDIAEGAGVFQEGKAAGEDRAVLEGLERRLGIRVVVRDVRPGMARVMFRSLSSWLTLFDVIDVPLST